MIDKAIILTDGKAGHENQSRAFARALGYDFDVVEVRFASRFRKAASYLLDRLGVCWGGAFRDFADMKELAGRGYAAVIGTGSGVFYAVKTVARRLGARCGVVLYPRGYRLSGFDCVLAPAFDRPRGAKRRGDPGQPCRRRRGVLRKGSGGVPRPHRRRARGRGRRRRAKQVRRNDAGMDAREA